MINKKKITVDEDGGIKDSAEEIVSDDGENIPNYEQSIGSKNDSDLFDESKYVVHKLISVKRVNSNKNGENWDIMENKKPVLRLKGERLTLKEREFLRTVNGVLFIIDGYKKGWNSINKFKQEMKDKK